MDWLDYNSLRCNTCRLVNPLWQRCHVIVCNPDIARRWRNNDVSPIAPHIDARRNFTGGISQHGRCAKIQMDTARLRLSHERGWDGLGVRVKPRTALRAVFDVDVDDNETRCLPCWHAYMRGVRTRKRPPDIVRVL